MLPEIDQTHPPTCGAVIQKQEGQEIVCPEPAADLITVVDPDNHTRVQAILLTCVKHSQDLENGKSLIFVAENKQGEPVERIAVQFTKEGGKNDANDAAPQ